MSPDDVIVMSGSGQSTSDSVDLSAAPGRQRLSGNAARGSLLYLVGTLVGSVANFLMLAVIQRSYGTSVFGVFAGVSALFLVLATLTRLGADTGATWYVSRLLAQRRSNDVAAVLRAALGPVLLTSVVAGLVTVTFAGPISDLLSNESGRDDFVSMMRILAFGVPLATVGEVLMGTTRGFGAMRPTVVSSQLGRQAGQLLTVAIAAATTEDVRALALAWVVPYLIPVVYPALWLARVVERRPRSAAHGGPFWRYAGPQAANSSAQIGLEKFDILALGPLVSEVAAGQYSAANRLAHVAVLGWYAVNVAHAPVWARLFELRERDAVRTSARRATVWSVVVVGPLLWSFAFFGRAWLGLIGSGLEDGAPALAVLASTVLLVFAVGPTENLLLMSGGSGRAFANNVVALAINIGLNLVLIPHFEAVGAAVAWAVALLTVRLLAASQVHRRSGVLVLGRDLVTVWLVVGAVCAASGLAARASVGDGLAGMASAMVASSVVLGALVWSRREAFGVPELVRDLRGRGARAGTEPEGSSAGTEPEGSPRRGAQPRVHVRRAPSLVGPHLEFSLRSRAAVRQPFTSGRVRRLVATVPHNGWRGRLLALVVDALARVAPARVGRLPWFTLHPNAPLPMAPELVRKVLSSAVDVLPEVEIDGVVWLLPPSDDEVRFGALLLARDEPVAHLRVRRRGRPVDGPRPTLEVGPRSGVRFPLTLALWNVDEVVCELTTVLGSGRHRPALVDDATLDEVIADIADALVDSPPRMGVDGLLHPMHGDLTPWNLRRDERSGELLLFDWEHAGWGPVDCDLIRYYATIDDGVERFSRRPAVRRRCGVDAVLHWRRVAQVRYSTPAEEPWKRDDRRREVRRLSALARLTSPD